MAESDNKYEMNISTSRSIVQLTSYIEPKEFATEYNENVNSYLLSGM